MNIAAAESPSLARCAPTGGREWLENGRAILDADGLVVEVEESFAQWIGSSIIAMVGELLPELLENEWPTCARQVQNLLNSSSSFLAATVDESGVWYQLQLVSVGKARVFSMSSTLPPRSELEEGSWSDYLHSEGSQRVMLARLLSAEAQLQKLGDRWPGVLFSQRSDFSFQFVSARIEELTGYPVEQWKREPQLFWDVVHDSDARELQEQIKRAARDRLPMTTTYRIRHARTGRIAYILEHRLASVTRGGLVLGYEGAWLDITRQTIAENRLSNAAWKETLAVVTMGLAHDFSNIMAGILSLSETFQMEFHKDDPAQEGLRLIQRNSIQANQLVQRIIKLHHGKAGERTYHDFNKLVEEILELIQKITPRRIQVKIQLEAESIPVYLDAVEFQQVFINLAINAVDAMPNSGTLTFRTSLHSGIPEVRQVHGVLPRMPCVCLSVQDTGSGIPERYRSAIFDPFFTTKSMNKGSGLGLYNAQLFCEKHQGGISVESEEKIGTTFRLWLPMADFHEGETDRALSISRRHTLLLIGLAGVSLDQTASFFREHQFYVVMARSREEAGEVLGSAEYQISGAVVQTTVAAADLSLILEDLRNAKPRFTIFLQIMGCNQDEIALPSLQAADVVLPTNAPPKSILASVRKALD